MRHRGMPAEGDTQGADGKDTSVASQRDQRHLGQVRRTKGQHYGWGADTVIYAFVLMFFFQCKIHNLLRISSKLFCLIIREYRDERFTEAALK